jgi:hypothetical protein
MSTDFKPGEIVDIAIKTATVCDMTGSHPPTLHFTVPTGRNISWSMPLDNPQITVERVAPAEWPPRVGDIWHDADGERWFAQDDGSSDVDPPVMWMVPAHPHRFSQEHDGGARGYQAARWQAKRGPVALVYREDRAVSA